MSPSGTSHSNRLSLAETAKMTILGLSLRRFDWNSIVFKASGLSCPNSHRTSLDVNHISLLLEVRQDQKLEGASISQNNCLDGNTQQQEAVSRNIWRNKGLL